jgi:hypothetical protein
VKLPKVNTSQFESFISALKKENVKPARGLLPLTQNNDGKYIEVDTLLNENYKKDHCWYNAKQHALKNNGEVIFGWALWQLSNDKFVAQHHAIYKNHVGSYFDVTLGNQGFKKILFLIDNRAPFDFKSLRGPVNFEYIHGAEKVWFTHGMENKDFFIGKFTGSEYVNTLLAQWELDGVL